MAWKRKVKRASNQKYANTKIEKYNRKFDSKLELFMFEQLSKYNVEFHFQKAMLLQDKFKAFKKGKKVTVRAIKWNIDFVIPIGRKLYISDTKGVMTPTASIKEKLAHKILIDNGVDYEINFHHGDVSKRKTLQPIINFCIFISDEQRKHGTGGPLKEGGLITSRDENDEEETGTSRRARGKGETGEGGEKEADDPIQS